MENEPPFNEPRPIFHDPPFPLLVLPSSSAPDCDTPSRFLSPPLPPPLPAPIAGHEWARSPHLRRSAALAGGGVAAVGVHALDDTNKTVTTTVEAAPSSSGEHHGEHVRRTDANAAFARSGGKSVSSDLQAGRAGRRHDHLHHHVVDVGRLLPLRPRPVAAGDGAGLRLRDRQAGPHPHERARRRGRHVGGRRVRGRRQRQGHGARPRLALRPRGDQGRRAGRASCTRSSWARSTASRSATRSSRSATRSATPRPSPRASSRPRAASSPRPRATTRSSPARSRPTPRSTTATRAARSSTATAT